MSSFHQQLTNMSGETPDDPILRLLNGDDYSVGTTEVFSAYAGEFLSGAGTAKGLYDAYQIGELQGDTLSESKRLELEGEGKLSRKLSEDDFKQGGYEDVGVEYFDGMREETAKYLFERKKNQQYNQSIISKATNLQSVLGFGAGIVASFADPVNVLTALVPVPGLTTARIAALTAKVGKTGARVAQGAAQGAFGSLLIEPLALGTADTLQDDYTMADTLFNIAVGSFIGGSLHVGVGALGDYRAARTEKAHMEATNTAIAQLTEGKVVDVEPIIKANVAERRKALVEDGRKIEPVAARELAQPTKFEGFELGELRGNGKAAKYSEYTPIPDSYRRYVEFANDELQTTQGGELIFTNNEFAPGQEVTGFKGTTPEWFSEYNKEAVRNNKARARAKKSKDFAKRDNAPESQSILTREKVAKVTDKLLNNKPLGKKEGEIAELLFSVADDIRDREIHDMTQYYDSMKEINSVDDDFTVQNELKGMVDRANSPESLRTADFEASLDYDDYLDRIGERDADYIDNEILELESEMDTLDLSQEDLDELAKFFDLETEAKTLSDTFLAAGTCIGRNA